jgi:pimeloyl-ACP methyl ester carboxylesterase
MKIETIFHRGRRDGPLLIFIHGMGTDLRIWNDPKEVKILGGLYPLKAMFHNSDGGMTTLFSDFKELGCSVLSWSQSRPVGPLEIALGELDALIKEYESYTSRGIVLIGHSKGGLIGRRYVEKKGEAVRGLITIATPHHGTTMARWSVLLSPAAASLHKLFGDQGSGLKKAVKRILGFFSSEGIRELLPDSLLYRELENKGRKDVLYMSIGGTSPDLIRFANISILELFSKIAPERAIPEEMKTGLGDGLVSAASSVLPYADHHYNFKRNHLSLLFAKEVRDLVTDEVRKISSEAV